MVLMKRIKELEFEYKFDESARIFTISSQTKAGIADLTQAISEELSL